MDRDLPKARMLRVCIDGQEFCELLTKQAVRLKNRKRTPRVWNVNLAVKPKENVEIPSGLRFKSYQRECLHPTFKIFEASGDLNLNKSAVKQRH